MKYTLNSLEETKGFAEALIRSLEAGKQAVVIALVGDLGSGKTTFSQLVGEVLGVKEGITSPTYLIEKIYELHKEPWKHFVHIDTYRLDNPKELIHLGWNEIIGRGENLVLVEWADKIKDILPPDTIWVRFTVLDETSREVEISSNVQN